MPGMELWVALEERGRGEMRERRICLDLGCHTSTRNESMWPRECVPACGF
jgi:hypothetical protein